MQGLTRTTTLSLTLFSTSLWADVHYVAPGQSIQAAVDAAADGDVIRLGTGVHIEFVSFMGRDISIVGEGPEETIWTNVSGGMLQAVYSLTEISNVTFLGGTGVSEGFTTKGGAIQIAGGQCHVSTCKFFDNESNAGGAIMANTADLTVSESHFEGNALSGGLEGGEAILIDYGSIEISSCSFIENGTNSSGYSSGVVESKNANLHAVNCLFQDNFGIQSGGLGLINASGSAVHCSFINNDYFSAFGYNANWKFLNCLFAENGGSESNIGAVLHTGGSIQYGGCVLQDQFMGDDGPVSTPQTVQNLMLDTPNLIDVDGRLSIADSNELRAIATTADMLYDQMTPPTVDIDGLSRPVNRMVGAVEHQVGADPNPCQADLNGDDLIDYQDLILLLNRWGVSDTYDPADRDLDGFIGLPELTMLLSEWGDCP